jgi:orotate phosphoribosyltransferase
VGEVCCQPRSPLLSATTDDDRYRALHRFWKSGRVPGGIVHAVKVERLSGRRVPETGDDLELLAEAFKSHAEWWERDAVCQVFIFKPPGADPKLNSATRHLIDLGDGNCEWARKSKCRGRDESAETNRARFPSEARQGHPRVGRPRHAVAFAHFHVVVGPEEPVEPEIFGLAGDAKQIVVRGALLGFDKDPEVHRHNVTFLRGSLPYRCRMASQALIDHLLAHSVRRGDFVLKSGKTTTWFLDTKQSACRPDGMLLIAKAALALLPPEATAIGGLTMGADPLAFGIAAIGATRGVSLRSFSVRKEAKDHGVTGRVAGALLPGDKVIITEDTATRGTSAMEAVEAVRAFGAEPIMILAIVDRGGTVGAMAREAGLAFAALATAPDLGFPFGS